MLLWLQWLLLCILNNVATTSSSSTTSLLGWQWLVGQPQLVATTSTTSSTTIYLLNCTRMVRTVRCVGWWALKTDSEEWGERVSKKEKNVVDKDKEGQWGTWPQHTVVISEGPHWGLWRQWGWIVRTTICNNCNKKDREWNPHSEDNERTVDKYNEVSEESAEDWEQR